MTTLRTISMLSIVLVAGGCTRELRTLRDSNVDLVPPEQPRFVVVEPVTNSPDLLLELQAIGAVRADVSEAADFAVVTGFTKAELANGPVAYRLSATLDGIYPLFARFADEAGNLTEPLVQSVTLDTEPPAGDFYFDSASVVVAGDGRTLTRTSTVRLIVTSTGATSMRVVEGDDCALGADVPVTAVVDFTLDPATEGVHHVSLCLVDEAGNGYGPVTYDLTLDTLAPVCGLALEGAEGVIGVTRQTEVTARVTIAEPADAAAIVMSNYPSLSSAVVTTLEPYDGPLAEVTLPWALLSGDGTKTVFVACRDEVGNVGDATPADIVLDSTPPAAPTLQVSYVDDPSGTSASKQVRLAWTAASDALTYTLERLVTGSDSDFVMLAEGAVSSNPTDNHHDDTRAAPAGQRRFYRLFVTDVIGNRSAASATVSVQVVTPVESLAVLDQGATRRYSWTIPSGSPLAQAFYRYTGTDGRAYEDPQPVNASSFVASAHADWRWNEELVIRVNNADADLVQESHFAFGRNRLWRLDENVGGQNGTVALGPDGRVHMAFVETRLENELVYAVYDGTRIVREPIAVDVAADLALAVDGAGDVHLVYDTNADLNGDSAADGITYARRSASSGQWQKTCISCLNRGFRSWYAPSLAVDAAGHPHIMYNVAGDYPSIQYVTTVGDSQTEFVVEETPTSIYPSYNGEIRTLKPTVRIDGNRLRAAFFTTDWGWGQNYFNYLARDVGDAGWDTAYSRQYSGSAPLLGWYASPVQLALTRAGHVQVYMMASDYYEPTRSRYVQFDATVANSDAGTWQVAGLGTVPVSSYGANYDFMNNFNSITYDGDTDTTVFLDNGKVAVLEGSAFVHKAVLFTAGLRRASPMLRSSDGLYHGIQSATHGELYYFEAAEGDALQRSASLITTKVVRQLSSAPTALTIPHSLALDAAEQPAIAYYDELSGELRYAVPSGAGWSVEPIDSYSIHSARVSCINFWAWWCAKYETSQPRLAFGPDGNPQVVYERYADATVWYAVRIDGAWETRLLGSGTSPALAVDALNQAHIVYVGSTFSLDPGFNRGPDGSPPGPPVYDPTNPQYLDPTVHAFPGGDLKYVVGSLDDMTETSVPVDAPWAHAGAATPAIALDAAGQPHVAYTLYVTNYAWGAGVAYTHLQTGEFTPTAILNGGGFFPSIAISPQDEVYVSSYNMSGQMDMVRLTPTVISTWRVGDTSDRRVNWSAMAFDPTGQVVIDALNYDAKTLFLAYYDYGWQIWDLVHFSAAFPVVFGSSYGNISGQGDFGTTHDLKIDRLGRPHITYYNLDTHSLHYMTRAMPFRGILQPTSIDVVGGAP